jgi:hypothetical protein
MPIRTLLRPTADRRRSGLLGRFAPFALFALNLASACSDPSPPPASPVSEPPPSSPVTEPPPVSSAPATIAAVPVADAGDGLPVISAGVPTIVAEAPTVSPEAARVAPARTAKPTAAATVERSAASPAVGPGRTAEQTAQGVIRSHFADVEACYAPVAQRDPSIGGRLVVQWTLGADGTPTAVAIVNDTLRSPAVTECIRARARTWRFPPPGSGVSVVRYPFDLRVQ